MQARPMLTTSLGLNLALVAALLYQVSVLPKPDQFRRHGLSVTNNVTELDVEVVRPPAPGAPPPFKWSDVEAADYRVYIENLKRIGCPPATIQDIILADVRDDFAHKRSVMMAPMHEHFWDLVAGAPGKDPLQSKELDKLEEQKETLLNQLMAAIGPVQEPATPPKTEPKLNFLTPEQRQAVSAVEAKYRTLRNELFTQVRQSPAQQEEKMESIRNLQPQQEEEIRQVLSATEWEEYRLRSSRNAQWAARLYGFEPTPQEFRAVTRLLDGLKKPAPIPGAVDPVTGLPIFPEISPASPADQLLTGTLRNPSGTGNNAEAAEKGAVEQIAYQAVLAEKLQKYFGEKRYADYQRAADPGFESLYKVVDRYQLPAETAVQAYQVRQAAEEQYKTVMRQETLTDDQRVEAVLTVHAATARALQKTLGAEVYETYLKRDGSWLERMIQP